MHSGTRMARLSGITTHRKQEHSGNVIIVPKVIHQGWETPPLGCRLSKMYCCISKCPQIPNVMRPMVSQCPTPDGLEGDTVAGPCCGALCAPWTASALPCISPHPPIHCCPAVLSHCSKHSSWLSLPGDSLTLASGRGGGVGWPDPTRGFLGIVGEWDALSFSRGTCLSRSSTSASYPLRVTVVLWLKGACDSKGFPMSRLEDGNLSGPSPPKWCFCSCHHHGPLSGGKLQGHCVSQEPAFSTPELRCPPPFAPWTGHPRWLTGPHSFGQACLWPVYLQRACSWEHLTKHQNYIYSAQLHCNLPLRIWISTVETIQGGCGWLSG